MTNEQRIVRGINRALDGRYADLTAWEKQFLASLRDIYHKQKSLSVKQKACATNVFKRLQLSLDDL